MNHDDMELPRGVPSIFSTLISYMREVAGTVICRADSIMHLRGPRRSIVIVASIVLFGASFASSDVAACYYRWNGTETILLPKQTLCAANDSNGSAHFLITCSTTGHLTTCFSDSCRCQPCFVSQPERRYLLLNGSTICSSGACEICTQRGWVPTSLPNVNCSSIDCNWYGKCLDGALPCSNTTFNYATGYAQPACSGFLNALPLFSPLGQLWIKAVEACLIRQIEVHRNESHTCEDLWNVGFGSHVQCYLEPAPNRSNASFCDLPADDIVLLSSIGLNVVLGNSRGCKPTSEQALQVFETCAKQSPSVAVKFAIVAARLAVKLQTWSTALSCLDSTFRSSLLKLSYGDINACSNE
ncbi:uncharacterized protein [Oscarella lobularis]|uniref:uncharacterized protein n=1 Tax=Oscarella lobularis TaxID=121494 RepID=UPI0033130BA3